ncbi:dihydroorotase [Patescibacteria group bacterium]|nr:dihydroorotase [Patescibacteria group bacterium]
MKKIEMVKSDDWHCHVRDNEMLNTVLHFTQERFDRAIIMPNLLPPVTSIPLAKAYKKRIISALAKESNFTPLMTIYLTDKTNPQEIEKGFKEGVWVAAKLYPAGATTNSDAGVTDIKRIYQVFKKMQKIGMPLLVHGEQLIHNGNKVDIFDREIIFINQTLTPLLVEFPELKVVLEHITTKEASSFVWSMYKQHGNIAATITPHHLCINRNDIFEGGIRPDLYCLPIAKREVNRIALRKAATSGKKCFFLGTDSAPHFQHRKYDACGCAGIFNAPVGIELYASVFEEEGMLSTFESFASINGPKFYGLPVNKRKMTLIREPWTVPNEIVCSNSDILTPFMAGEKIPWKIAK